MATMNKGTETCLIMTKLDYIGEDPISVLGHILRYLGLEDKYIFGILETKSKPTKVRQTG